MASILASVSFWSFSIFPEISSVLLFKSDSSSRIFFENSSWADSATEFAPKMASSSSFWIVSAFSPISFSTVEIFDKSSSFTFWMRTVNAPCRFEAVSFASESALSSSVSNETSLFCVSLIEPSSSVWRFDIFWRMICSISESFSSNERRSSSANEEASFSTSDMRDAISFWAISILMFESL